MSKPRDLEWHLLYSKSHAIDWYVLFSGSAYVKYVWRHQRRGYVMRKREIAKTGDVLVPDDLEEQFEAFRAESAKARVQLLADYKSANIPAKLRWHQVGLYLTIGPTDTNPSERTYHAYLCATESEAAMARELLFYADDTGWRFHKRHYDLVWRYVILRKEPAYIVLARVLSGMVPQNPFRESMARLLRVLADSEEEKATAALEVI